MTNHEHECFYCQCVIRATDFDVYLTDTKYNKVKHDLHALCLHTKAAASYSQRHKYRYSAHMQSPWQHKQAGGTACGL